MVESTGSSYEEPVRSDIRFQTVTDLIDFYKVTSDKGKGKVLMTEDFTPNGFSWVAKTGTDTDTHATLTLEIGEIFRT